MSTGPKSAQVLIVESAQSMLKKSKAPMKSQNANSSAQLEEEAPALEIKPLLPAEHGREFLPQIADQHKSREVHRDHASQKPASNLSGKKHSLSYGFPQGHGPPGSK